MNFIFFILLFAVHLNVKKWILFINIFLKPYIVLSSVNEWSN